MKNDREAVFAYLQNRKIIPSLVAHFYSHFFRQRMNNRFEQVRDLILNLEGDFDKFYNKNNQAAGTRVRQGMQTLKELAQEIRTEVQKMKNDAKDA